jgi:hypothetical protein
MGFRQLEKAASAAVEGTPPSCIEEEIKRFIKGIFLIVTPKDLKCKY